MFFLIGFLGCVTFIITHKYVLRLQTVFFKRGTKKALFIVKVADPGLAQHSHNVQLKKYWINIENKLNVPWKQIKHPSPSLRTWETVSGQMKEWFAHSPPLQDIMTLPSFTICLPAKMNCSLLFSYCGAKGTKISVDICIFRSQEEHLDLCFHFLSWLTAVNNCETSSTKSLTEMAKAMWLTAFENMKHELDMIQWVWKYTSTNDRLKDPISFFNHSNTFQRFFTFWDKWESETETRLIVFTRTKQFLYILYITHSSSHDS